MDDSKKLNQKIFLSFVVGLILGGGITWFVLGTEVLSPTVDDIENIDSGNTTVIPDGNSNLDSRPDNIISTGENRIVIDNQLEGDRVLIGEVKISESSWVVVHEEVGGVLGNALGAARFDPGAYSGGYIDLLRNTETGGTYQVLLYKDNGDKEFNLDDDRLIVDSEGASVGTSFEAIRVDRKIN